MQVAFSNTAQKQLKKLPKTERVKVIKKIRVLKENPLAGKKLSGMFEGKRSIRSWPYRVIYRYTPDTKSIFINVIEHRQGVYK